MIVGNLKNVENNHGVTLNHWFGGIFFITVQTFHDIQYLTIIFSGYINIPIDLLFGYLGDGVQYLIHNQHEP